MLLKLLLGVWFVCMVVVRNMVESGLWWCRLDIDSGLVLLCSVLVLWLLVLLCRNYGSICVYF